MILSNYFCHLGLKHLRRILQLPEMSSRLVGLDHFCKWSPDESLALWPVWASYSQAKTEVYIQYINIYIYTGTHTESMHTYSEKPQMDRRCMSRQLVTEVLLTKTPWSFHALFLFSHIFLLSHTFVDILCCFGQMYVRDHVSVLSCLLSTADDFAVFHFSLHCRPVFSFCWCLFSIYLLLINVLRPHCIWSRVHF